MQPYLFAVTAQTNGHAVILRFFRKGFSIGEKCPLSVFDAVLVLYLTEVTLVTEYVLCNFCQVQVETDFLLIIQNKTNKNNPVREKTDWQTGRLTGWKRLEKAEQGRTRQGRTGHKAYNKRRRTNKEITKGENEEGNEGEQLEKINQ